MSHTSHPPWFDHPDLSPQSGCTKLLYAFLISSIWVIYTSHNKLYLVSLFETACSFTFMHSGNYHFIISIYCHRSLTLNFKLMYGAAFWTRILYIQFFPSKLHIQPTVISLIQLSSSSSSSLRWRRRRRRRW